MKRLSLCLLAWLVWGCVTTGSRSQAHLDPAQVENITLAPISTFKSACARCHGDEGRNYGDAFAHLDAPDLHRVVEDMLFGPGFLTPTPTEVNAMVAYHRAIADKTPFACITNARAFATDMNRTLIVETSPDAAVHLSSGRLEKQDGLWRLHDVRLPLTLTVERNGRRAAFTFPPALWTQETPQTQ